MGSPSGIKYRRGFAIPARAASRSTVEWSNGASPNGSSRAPIIPSTTRSKVQYAPAARRSAQKTKIVRPRTPSSSQPTSAKMPTSASTSSQDLRMLRAATSTPYPPLAVFAAVFLPVVLEQAARRPVVVLRCVAAARAVERRDVLERDEDVAVQLDVRDLVDEAVRSQDALLILPAEEGDLDLLALVFARVVLHRQER